MMNIEESLDVLGVVKYTYAKVAGLYVTDVSFGSYGGVKLTPYYTRAENLAYAEIEWLHENVEGIEFFTIDVQAQSLPIKAEELLS